MAEGEKLHYLGHNFRVTETNSRRLHRQEPHLLNRFKPHEAGYTLKFLRRIMPGSLLLVVLTF